MKTEMSSFDIMAMTRELQLDMRVKKIFQPSPTHLRVQLRFKEGGTGNLSVEVGKRMYLSEFAMPSPKFPSNFAMTLRKYLSNAKVKEIRQVGFDRIVEMVAETKEGDFKLIFELFGEGNVILADAEGRIKAVMKKRRFKHRELVGSEMYVYPPQRLNPFQLSPEEISGVVEKYGNLVKALAVPLGLGGLYSEEVCMRAGIKKDTPSLTPEEAETVTQVLKDLKEEALDPKPVIILENSTPVDVAPMRLAIYEGKETKEFPTFNKALDEFFTEREVETIEEEVEKAFKEGLTTMNIRLREQARAIARFNREAKDGRLIGDTIYGNFDAVQELVDTIARARKTMPAKEIKAKLKDVEAVKQYLPKENAVVVNIGGLEFKLDLALSASKNADYYYSRSKKAREKLKGARGAVEKTKTRITEYLEKGRLEVQAQEKMPVKRTVKKRKWYERFRWFISSEGFLVIGGRDATSNEMVVKRHMEKGDVFVHADIHGAPAVVVKAEGKGVPQKTIEEACEFAASNSIAWKNLAAFLDVYWVNPEQVSKTPKSGEYVGKGAFIIRGKRNYIRSKLVLSVGFTMNKEAEVMCGPVDAVERNCDYHVTIAPGHLKSKEVAQKILGIVLKMAKDEHKNTLKRLNLDEIQRVLPTGGHSIVEKKR